MSLDSMQRACHVALRLYLIDSKEKRGDRQARIFLSHVCFLHSPAEIFTQKGRFCLCVLGTVRATRVRTRVRAVSLEEEERGEKEEREGERFFKLGG
jgi:hypothetical protein